MPFTVEEFIELRPFVYHLTASSNIDRIKRTNSLEPAAVLLRAAGESNTLTVRRPASLQVKVKGEVIHIRDQHPLHAGNIQFQGNWTIDKLIEEINERVFFWPGSAMWVTSYAVRHFQRYASEKPVVLRVPLAPLISANPGNAPMFCKYNSGSPRWTSGKASPRGPETFVKCDKAVFRPSGVVEVTFRSSLKLPSGVAVANSYDGKWSPL